MKIQKKDCEAILATIKKILPNSWNNLPVIFTRKRNRLIIDVENVANVEESLIFHIYNAINADDELEDYESHKTTTNELKPWLVEMTANGSCPSLPAACEHDYEGVKYDDKGFGFYTWELDKKQLENVELFGSFNESDNIVSTCTHFAKDGSVYATNGVRLIKMQTAKKVTGKPEEFELAPCPNENLELAHTFLKKSGGSFCEFGYNGKGNGSLTAWSESGNLYMYYAFYKLHESDRPTIKVFEEVLPGEEGTPEVLCELEMSKVQSSFETLKNFMRVDHRRFSDCNYIIKSEGMELIAGLDHYSHGASLGKGNKKEWNLKFSGDVGKLEKIIKKHGKKAATIKILEVDPFRVTLDFIDADGKSVQDCPTVFACRISR